MSYLLNEQQETAANIHYGPLLIAAGPGTGKTSVLINRIISLIEKDGVSPENILAVTFTNRAAREINNRIKDTIKTKSRAIHIGTFHSICLKILREHIHLLGRESSFNIYDEDDTITTLSLILSKEKDRIPDITPKKLYPIISSIKNRLSEIEEYNDFKDIINKYEETLLINNAFDFDDILIKVIELFTKHPHVLFSYQDLFRFIMVDEYQDINQLQYSLIQLLSARDRNICVIGDADQAIYAFRGANVKNFLNFQNDYPEAKIVKLEENYRSNAVILQAANEVISKNIERIYTKLFTRKTAPDYKISLVSVNDEREEGKRIVREIESLLGGTSFKSAALSKTSDTAFCVRGFADIAVLYRIHTLGEIIEENLFKAGIPYRVIGGSRFSDKKGIRELLAYLRLILNSNDNISFLKAVNTPNRGIGEKRLGEIRSASLQSGGSYFITVEDGILSKSADASLKIFCETIKQFMDLSKETTLERLLTHIIEKIDLVSYLVKSGEDEKEITDNLSTLISSVIRFDKMKGVEALKEFTDELFVSLPSDHFEISADAVTLMTIHASKGLEFPVVFVSGLEDGVTPYIRQSGYNEEEERRLFYVAITRAKERLYLFHAKKRFMHGTQSVKPVSRFITDISKEIIETITIPGGKKDTKVQLRLFD